MWPPLIIRLEDPPSTSDTLVCRSIAFFRSRDGWFSELKPLRLGLPVCLSGALGLAILRDRRAAEEVNGVPSAERTFRPAFHTAASCIYSLHAVGRRSGAGAERNCEDLSVYVR